MRNRDWIKLERRRKAKYRKFRLFNLALRKLERFEGWINFNIAEFNARCVKLHNVKYDDRIKSAIFEFRVSPKQAKRPF